MVTCRRLVAVSGTEDTLQADPQLSGAIESPLISDKGSAGRVLLFLSCGLTA